VLSEVEPPKLTVAKTIASKKKSQYGQFFTPAEIARFMAGLFAQKVMDNCRLLDAGAGIGSLTSAFLERQAPGGLDFRRVEVDAFEIDKSLHPI